MCLVKRVADQVHQRERVEPEAAFHHHEAHLCDGRPGQPHLDADPRQHDEPREQRGG